MATFFYNSKLRPDGLQSRKIQYLLSGTWQKFTSSKLNLNASPPKFVSPAILLLQIHKSKSVLIRIAIYACFPEEFAIFS